MDRMTQNEPLRDGTAPGRTDGIFARRGIIRRVLRYGGILVLLCMAAIIASFVMFADSVTNLRPPDVAKADAIVVLTGG